MPILQILLKIVRQYCFGEVTTLRGGSRHVAFQCHYAIAHALNDLVSVMDGVCAIQVLPQLERNLEKIIPTGTDLYLWKAGWWCQPRKKRARLQWAPCEPPSRKTGSPIASINAILQAVPLRHFRFIPTSRAMARTSVPGGSASETVSWCAGWMTHYVRARQGAR